MSRRSTIIKDSVERRYSNRQVTMVEIRVLDDVEAQARLETLQRLIARAVLRKSRHLLTQDSTDDIVLAGVRK